MQHNNSMWHHMHHPAWCGWDMMLLTLQANLSAAMQDLADT